MCDATFSGEVYFIFVETDVENLNDILNKGLILHNASRDWFVIRERTLPKLVIRTV